MTGLVILLSAVGTVVVLLIMTIFWSICMAAERADRWEDERWK
jgi:hypothetical protein